MSVVPRSAEPAPMSEEQKFLFDLKGWVLIPGVLEPDLLEALRQHVVKLRKDAESLPAYERYSLAGPGQDRPSARRRAPAGGQLRRPAAPARPAPGPALGPAPGPALGPALRPALGRTFADTFWCFSLL